MSQSAADNCWCYQYHIWHEETKSCTAN